MLQILIVLLIELGRRCCWRQELLFEGRLMLAATDGKRRVVMLLLLIRPNKSVRLISRLVCGSGLNELL